MEKLTYCKKCHGEIKEGDKVCPNCGAKVQGKKGCLVWILGVAAVIIVIASISTCSNTDNSSSGTQNTSTSSTAAPNNKEDKTKNKKNDNTALSIFTRLQENDSMPFTIPDKANKMLSEHPELFSKNSKEGIDVYTDTAIQYKHLSKNIDDYGDKLIFIPEAYVVSAEETKINDYDVLTEFHLSDADNNSYYVFSLNKHPEIFEEDIVKFYGLPIGQSSFSNVSGGTTLVIVCANSYIEKTE